MMKRIQTIILTKGNQGYCWLYIKLVRVTILSAYGRAMVNILIGLIIKSYFFSPTYYAAGPDTDLTTESRILVPAKDIPTQDINPVPRVAVNPTHGLHQISSRAAGLAAEQALLSSNPPACISSQQAAIISSESTANNPIPTESTTENISSTPEQPAQTSSIWKTLLIRVKNLFVWLVSLFWGTTPDTANVPMPTESTTATTESIIPPATTESIIPPANISSQSPTIISSSLEPAI